MPDVMLYKQVSLFLLLLALTGCAHLTRQEWHDVVLGPCVHCAQGEVK